MANELMSDSSQSLEKGALFLTRFVVPMMKAEGFRYLIFSQNSTKGIFFVSDKNSVPKACDMYCRLTTIENAVAIASDFGINAKKHVCYLEGTYYEFAANDELPYQKPNLKKTKHFLDDFVERKFDEIIKKMPNEGELFCSIFLNRYRGISYVSDIDTHGEFSNNYSIQEIEQAVPFAKEKGYEITVKEMNDHLKVMIISKKCL